MSDFKIDILESQTSYFFHPTIFFAKYPILRASSDAVPCASKRVPNSFLKDSHTDRRLFKIHNLSTAMTLIPALIPLQKKYVKVTSERFENPK